MATWKDLDHTLVKNAKGDVKIAEDIEAVYGSVSNIIGTVQGSRVMLPEFAAGIVDALFDPIDEDMVDFASARLAEVIEDWDDRVSVTGIEINSDPDRSEVSITVDFRIVGYDEIFQFSDRVKGV